MSKTQQNKKWNWHYLVVFIMMSMLTATTTQAQISGTVFRDYNANGLKDNTATFNEVGVKGILVIAYKADGSVADSVRTAANGTYSLTNVTTGTQYRIEFVIPNEGSNCIVNSKSDFSSGTGSVYGSSVQFVASPNSTTNFALGKPSEYATTSFVPDVFIPQYVNGDPLAGGTSASDYWFLGFPYTNFNYTTPQRRLTGSVIGSCYGVAVSKQSGKVFTSAFMKRHSGFGTLGSGGIYMLTPTATSFTAVGFYDMDANGYRTRSASGCLAYGNGSSYTMSGYNITYNGSIDPVSNEPCGFGVIGTNAERGMAAAKTTPNFDQAAFDQVGKVSLGDIEISDDGRYLFVTNLFDKKIYRLELDNPSNPTSVISVSSYSLPTFSCSNGVLRPMALEFYRGKLYVGAVCTGENGGQNIVNGASDLNGYIFQLDNPTTSPSFNTTPKLTIPLNYQKGKAYTTSPTSCDQWQPWINNFGAATYSPSTGYICHPQPILADIDFNSKGQIVVSFTDRIGHQVGWFNRSTNTSNSTNYSAVISGDVLLVEEDGQLCSIQLENNGSTTTYTGSGVGNNQGLGGGEFFAQDNFGTGHYEAVIGGMAILPQRDEIIIGFMDPLAINTGGIKKMSLNNGTASGGYQLNSASTIGYYGKGNSLGDIELSGEIPNIEVGNRVWLDTDGDGIQDAGENPISGVIVQLVNGSGTVIATATTDANGNYYFSNATGTSTASTIYGITALTYNTNYCIRIPNVQGGSKQAVLGTNVLTVANNDATANGDSRDSDGTLNGNNAEICFTTGNAGENNHSFDSGFRAFCSTPECGGIKVKKN